MENREKNGFIRAVWDDNIKNHYVYAHYRANSNELFYIGIGTYGKGDTIGRKYIRAYSCAKSQRNYLWFRVYKKYGRRVQILYENLSEKEAKEKEIELIAQYGTLIKRTGSLCNISEGGEGRFKDNTMCKKLYSYDLQGHLLKEFSSCNEAADYYKIDRRCISLAANMKRKTCGGMQFRYEYNKDQNLLNLQEAPIKKAKRIVCTNTTTGEILYFDSIYKFCQYIGDRSNYHVLEVIKGNRKHVRNWVVQYDT